MSECNTVNLEKAAELLYRVRMNATTIDAIPIEQRPDSLDGSYRLQDCLNRKLASTSLGPVIGYKIGCTTEVMQSYLNIAHPCAGALFESTVRRSDGTFLSTDLCRPGVECEIAVQIDQNVSTGSTVSIDDCESLVRRAMVSIELVDDRWADFQKVDTPTLIADNFFGAGCVLGPEVVATGNQLRQATGTMCINGQSVGSGTGADILGHPYEALCWLAGHLTKRGTPLRAGDYVSLGSVVKTQWLTKGDRVDIEFSDLGHCSLNLA